MLTPQQLSEAVAVFTARNGRRGRLKDGKTIIGLAREYGMTRSALRNAIDRELERASRESANGV